MFATRASKSVRAINFKALHFLRDFRTQTLERKAHPNNTPFCNFLEVSLVGRVRKKPLACQSHITTCHLSTVTKFLEGRYSLKIGLNREGYQPGHRRRPFPIPWLHDSNKNPSSFWGTQRSSSNMALDKIKVLFAGVEFPEAYEFSAKLLRRDPSIQVAYFPREEVPDHIADFDVVVPRMVRLDSATLARAKKLKLIVQFGVGLEGVDIPAATAAGIQVARIASGSTGNAVSCAEHCIYLILGLLRNQHGMAKAFSERRLGQPIGRSLATKNVLIVGYGAIGKELAPRLRPFGVRISAVRRSWNQRSGLPQIIGEDSEPIDSAESDAVAAAAAADVVPSVTPKEDEDDPSLDEKGGTNELPRFLSKADVVVMCCLLTAETAGMVNEEFIAAMKPGALLINIARGGLLDYNAVKDAIFSGRLGGLGIDVAWEEPFDPDDPIAGHPSVIITPHIGGVTDISYHRMSQIINDTVQQLKAGQPLTLVEIAN